MSLFTPPPPNADKEQLLFAKPQENAFKGYRHDRQDITDEYAGNMARSSAGTATDISAAQKMISATWGSVLTSLLGTISAYIRFTIESTADSGDSHTA